MSDLLNLDRQICFSIYSAMRAINRAYKPLLKPLKLTYSQYLVMLVLWESDTALTLKAIGQRLNLDSGTLTPLLKRLEKQNYLHRLRNHEDEREILVSLTEQGRQLQGEANTIPGCLLKQFQLDLAEMRQIRETMQRLVQGSQT